MGPVSETRMVDKIVSVPRTAISREIGECDSREIEAIEDGLRRWLGLAPP